MRLTLLVSLLSLLALAACEGAPAADLSEGVDSALPSDDAMSDTAVVERQRTRPGVDYIFYPDEPMKPAYRTAFEPLKADVQDDIRWSNPERYSITIKPPAAARPMVEWEPMQAIVMSTPQWITTYPGAKDTVTQIAVNAATVGEVWFIVDNNGAVNNMKGLMLDAGMNQDVMDAQVKFLIEPIDSIWFIDSGPLPLVDDTTNTFAFTDFRYYWDRALDDGIPTFLGRNLPDQAPISTYRMPLNTEGGTFQSTTDGICVTGDRQLYYMSCDDGSCDQSITEMPLDEMQTHPLAEEVRQIWKDYAGCTDLIVTNSITDDGTGHIDMYLKIASDNVVIIGDYMEELEQSEVWNYQTLNRERMDANAALFEAYVKPDGTNFEVKRIVMPGHRSAASGDDAPEWMPFTYINSTFINGLNLWPAFTFSDWEPSRNLAEGQWNEALPDMDHVWIDSEELSFWSGAIHCITRTVPDLAPGEWVADGTCGADGNCQAPADGYDGECRPNDLTEDICWGPAWECDCNDCTTACDYEPSSGGGGGGDTCNGIGGVGCCDGGTLYYCQDGQLGSESCSDGCGWVSGKSWYDCGGTGADPSGNAPLSCAEVRTGDTGGGGGVCVPDCLGKVCGDDGCGSSCGTCAVGSLCSATGTCEADPSYQVCTDICVKGTSQCSTAPGEEDIPQICGVLADGCTEWASIPSCADQGLSCVEGRCEDLSGGDTGGGDTSGCAGGSTTESVIPMLFALLLMLGVRRRTLLGS